MNSDRDTPDQVRGGLPHSEVPGSPIARISPGLFAACHVLHRLSVPRHPPDALVSRLITASPSPAMPTTAAHRAKPHALPPPQREPTVSMKTLLSDPPAASLARPAGPPRSHHNSLCTLQSTPPRRPAAVSRDLLRTSGRACQQAHNRLPAAHLSPTRNIWCQRHPGGGERTRTDDLLLAKQALSQLSYTPAQNSVISGQSSEILITVF